MLRGKKTKLVTPTLNNANMAEDILTNLTTQLEVFNAQTNQVNRVSIKLPEFWTKSPEVWSWVMPFVPNCASTLANHTSGDLVQNSGSLMDKRPTALLRKINALNDDPQTLKRALFLANLPSDVRSILAGHNFTDTDALAEAADRVWEARTSGVQQVFRVPAETHSANTKPPFEQNVVTPSLDETVSAINRGKRQLTPQQRGTTSSSSVCFYHQRFGPDARRCLPGCKFASLLTKGSKQSTSSSGNANASR